MRVKGIAVIILLPYLVIGCVKRESENQFQFYKVNIVTPDPEKTIDSLQRLYDLPVFWEFYEGDGYASGGLLLSNAVLDIKTYFDSTWTSTEPTEMVFTTQLVDSIAYQKLLDLGIMAEKPFRMEGWFWSVITLPELDILGNQSNGIYVTRYDDAEEHSIELDSLQRFSKKRLDSVIIYSPKADALNRQWEKFPVSENDPIFEFIQTPIARMRIIISH